MKNYCKQGEKSKIIFKIDWLFLSFFNIRGKDSGGNFNDQYEFVFFV